MLKEASSLLSFKQAEKCCETKELVERKFKEIDNRSADLQRMKKTLGDLSILCETGSEGSHCFVVK